MSKGGWIVNLIIRKGNDEWKYSVNNEERKSLPNRLGTIKIEIGED
jgi:hypothetical protein